MSLVVNNNLMAANVARNLNMHYGNLSTSTERLSSGLRINSAADDAAGLAIRELQRADITTLHQGARNANDAISLIQTADGALQTIDEQLIRMKELAEQAATGTYNSTQRLMIESEYQSLASEITRISNATDFNGIQLLDGTLSGEYDGTELQAQGELKIHFGTSNDSAEDFYNINIGDTRAAALGLGNELVIHSELETNPTNAGYEELRDRSTEKIYDATYAERYETHYNEIYSNLVSTADTTKPPISAEAAAAQAAEQADVLASKEAAADAEMAKSTFDTVFDHTYFSTYYTDPRTVDFYDAEDAGTTTSAQEADHAAATQDALKAATDKMSELTQKISEDGNLTSLDAMLPLPAVKEMDFTADPPVATANDIYAQVDAFPVKSNTSANAYIEQVGKEAYDVIYDKIYNGDTGVDPAVATDDNLGMYESAIADAKKTLGVTTLTDEQTEAIQNMVHEAAHAKATEWSEALQAGMQKVYDDAYNDIDAATGLSAGDGYTEKYDAFLADGYPADIAQIMAEKDAATEGWTAMAAVRVAGAEIDYGIDPDTGVTKALSQDALAFTTTMDIPDSGNPPKQVTAYSGHAAPVGAAAPVAQDMSAAVYTAIGNVDDPDALPAVAGTGAMATYMDSTTGTRGLNGTSQGLIETAEYFADAFDGFSPAGSTISTQEAAGDALDAINEAIISKDKIRAHLGAIQNRLEETVNNLNIQAENLQASESRISDVDVATEMTEFVRNQILTQSAVAMLSQANSLPQMAQQIIGG